MTSSNGQRIGVATRTTTALVVAALLLAPNVALACPVCFGENDSPLAVGINYGILAMLVVVGGLWVAFGSFFIYLRRRAKMAEASSESPAEKGRHVPGVPQGGTI